MNLTNLDRFQFRRQSVVEEWWLQKCGWEHHLISNSEQTAPELLLYPLIPRRVVVCVHSRSSHIPLLRIALPANASKSLTHAIHDAVHNL